MDLMGDIVERETSQADAPPPGPPIAPKKQSRWKKAQKKQPAVDPAALDGTVAGKISDPSTAGDTSRSDLSEAEKVHLENLQKLATMSPDQIQHERDELIATMDPGILQRLLKRANAESEPEPDFEQFNPGNSANPSTDTTKSRISVDNQSKPLPETDKTANASKTRSVDPVQSSAVESSAAPELSDEPATPSATGSAQSATSVPSIARPPSDATPSEPSVHFPRPPFQPLDPNDPEFDKKLHEIYFPTLPMEPDKLAWMQPAESENGQPNAYDDPTVTEMSASELRFDFRGDILSPRQAQAIPTHRGLHHHGDNPTSAGYTVGELAHLGLSTVPSQRSMAWQTLGRILYKLGKGIYGQDIGPGLWGVIDYSKVVEKLTYAASNDRAIGVQAHAQEALWLLHQSGARRKAV